MCSSGAADAFDPEFYSKPESRGRDPIAWLGSEKRVVRGGAWLSIAQHCRSAFRAGSAPDVRFELIGFRAVLRLPR